MSSARSVVNACARIILRRRPELEKAALQWCRLRYRSQREIPAGPIAALLSEKKRRDLKFWGEVQHRLGIVGWVTLAEKWPCEAKQVLNRALYHRR